MALTYSYISSAQLVSTSVFCASSSKKASKSSSSGSLSPSSSCPRPTIICGRRGLEGALYSRYREGGSVAPVPNNFLDAKLRARLRALEAAREAALVGDDDKGGAL